MCVQWYNYGTHAKYVIMLNNVKTEVFVKRQLFSVTAQRTLQLAFTLELICY